MNQYSRKVEQEMKKLNGQFFKRTKMGKNKPKWINVLIPRILDIFLDFNTIPKANAKDEIFSDITAVMKYYQKNKGNFPVVSDDKNQIDQFFKEYSKENKNRWHCAIMKPNYLYFEIDPSLKILNTFYISIPFFREITQHKLIESACSFYRFKYHIDSYELYKNMLNANI